MPKVAVDGIVNEDGLVERAKPADIGVNVNDDDATGLAL
jgi:hypothetical protein